MLVVMAPVLDISVIDLYAAAFGPGFMLSGMYILYTLGRSYLNPKLGPPVPKELRPASMRIVLWECIVGLVPVSVLTIVTLGAILAGLTTAAEAAALGALGAIILAILYGKFTLKGFLEACNSTMATTAMVLFLAVASNVFGSVFAWLGTAGWITKALIAAPLPAWGTMSLLLGLIFLLGWPFEWPAIVLIFLPLLAPVAKGLGYDMVWFGCIVAVVLQTAFLSPPVAMSAYYLKQVVKQWNLVTIYRGMADFMVLQVIAVALVLIFPQIAMWFPNWLQERQRAERLRGESSYPEKRSSATPVIQPFIAEA
jgi:tripartite ATP-independent transporter DctM subunit